MNTATNRQKLENAVFQTAAIAQKYNCALKRLDFQQEEGLMSSLPIGVNQVEICLLYTSALSLCQSEPPCRNRGVRNTAGTSHSNERCHRAAFSGF